MHTLGLIPQRDAFPSVFRSMRSKQVLVDGASYPILMGEATTSHDTVIVQNTLPGWSLGWSPSGQKKEGVLQGSM